MLTINFWLLMIISLRYSQPHPHNLRTPLIEGYYWREYSGVIPSDALPGGTDHNGRPIYIGQSLHKEYIVAGKIYEWENALRHAWYGEAIATKNIKIFCTQNTEHFEWVATSISKVKLLTNRHIVVGGYQLDRTVYIGRAFHQTETSVGKVVVANDGSDIYGLLFTTEGQEHTFREFEILIYNPN